MHEYCHGLKHTTVIDHDILNNGALKLWSRFSFCHGDNKKLSGTSLSVHDDYDGLKHTTVFDHIIFNNRVLTLLFH